MNIIDIILIIIAAASAVYFVYLLVSKFPQLVNINTADLPGAKDEETKRKILEDKLKREVQKNFTTVRDLFGFKNWSLSGLLERWKDRLQQVEREYRRVLNKDLSSAVKKSKALEDLLTNAKTYLEQEEYGKAEDVLIDALNLNEHSIEAYLLLADVYAGKKELTHAKDTLEYVLTLTHNEDPKVFQGLAELSLARGNLKEAEEEYLRSISLDENNYSYYLQLAAVYGQMDEPAKALETAKKSLILAPNNPKILDFLVEISIILRDKQQGLDYLEKLREANPDNKKIDALREKLEAL